MRFANVWGTGLARRGEAIEEARERGLAGADRPGDEILFALGHDPSDSYIGQVADAFHEGQQERVKCDAQK